MGTIRVDARLAAHRSHLLGRRAALALAPLSLAVVIAALTEATAARLTPDAHPWLTGAVALAAATGSVTALDRIGRHMLPLQTLSRLSSLLPDQAPRLVSAALRSGGSMRRTAVDSPEPLIDLVNALTEHDRLTRGHCERVRAITRTIATEMNIQGHERERLEWAALLHDIGKIEVSSSVLNKPGAPDSREWVELRDHPGRGVTVAAGAAAWLGEDIHAIDQHHERFDGSGYPHGLRGGEISRAARIVAVADAYEVMTANRSYKRAMTPNEARAELAACSGTHFDPRVVRAFASLSLAPIPRAIGVAGWAFTLLL